MRNICAKNVSYGLVSYQPFRTRILQHYAVVIPAIDGMTTICISLSAVIAARLPIVVR